MREASGSIGRIRIYVGLCGKPAVCFEPLEGSNRLNLDSIEADDRQTFAS